jgi:hypothetical protein
LTLLLLTALLALALLSRGLETDEVGLWARVVPEDGGSPDAAPAPPRT